VSFGFERDHGDIPRTSPVSRRHAPARHALERFELENGACRPDRADSRRWDCIRTSLANRPERLTSAGPYCNPGTS